MPYRLLSDLVVVFHFAVVVFVIGGGLLVLRWRRVAWVHLPVIAWVIFAECFQKICPLTYLENWLRMRAGTGAYQGDFVAHYIVPVLYPEGLTPRIQIVLGLLIFCINAVLYLIAFLRPSKHAAKPSVSPRVVDNSELAPNQNVALNARQIPDDAIGEGGPTAGDEVKAGTGGVNSV